MYTNTALLQSYLCNVVTTALADNSNCPIGTKFARAAVSSIPSQITINTTPIISIMADNIPDFKQDPPSIQYKDGLELVSQWDKVINKNLEVIDTGLVIGDLVKK